MHRVAILQAMWYTVTNDIKAKEMIPLLVKADKKWDYALGMIKVDGLEPTPEMKELIKNVRFRRYESLPFGSVQSDAEFDHGYSAPGQPADASLNCRGWSTNAVTASGLKSTAKSGLAIQSFSIFPIPRSGCNPRDSGSLGNRNNYFSG